MIAISSSLLLKSDMVLILTKCLNVKTIIDTKIL